jgi:hypothetical protein
MRWLIAFVMTLAVLAAPAHAQRRGGAAPAQPSAEDLDKKRQEQALDSQYKSALQRMKTDPAPARIDPWANVRGSDTSKR